MDRDGNGELHLAVKNGTLEALQRLMPQDALDLDLEARNGALETPLHLAVQHDSLEMAEFLIQRGAKVDAITATGETPLMLAGTTEMMSLLIQHDARVDAVNSVGKTALHLAAVQNYDLTRTLLAAGANVSLHDRQGQTALYEAVDYEKVYIAELLIIYGSDPSTVCVREHSPASLATLQNNKPMVDAIKKAKELQINYGAAMGLHHRAGEHSDRLTLPEAEKLEKIMHYLEFPEED